MRLSFKYETGVITFIQFITLSLLGIANTLNSIITTCINTGADCVSNTIVSIIFYLLTVAWFAFVWILAFSAQERRSRKMAWLLMAAEALIALVALFNAKHHTDILSLLTSLVDLILAAWIILLAFRLTRARGGRVVVRQRSRRRRHPTQASS